MDLQQLAILMQDALDATAEANSKVDLLVAELDTIDQASNDFTFVAVRMEPAIARLLQVNEKLTESQNKLTEVATNLPTLATDALDALTGLDFLTIKAWQDQINILLDQAKAAVE